MSSSRGSCCLRPTAAPAPPARGTRARWWRWGRTGAGTEPQDRRTCTACGVTAPPTTLAAGTRTLPASSPPPTRRCTRTAVGPAPWWPPTATRPTAAWAGAQRRARRATGSSPTDWRVGLQRDPVQVHRAEREVFSGGVQVEASASMEQKYSDYWSPDWRSEGSNWQLPHSVRSLDRPKHSTVCFSITFSISMTAGPLVGTVSLFFYYSLYSVFNFIVTYKHTFERN